MIRRGQWPFLWKLVNTAFCQNCWGVLKWMNICPDSSFPPSFPFFRRLGGRFCWTSKLTCFSPKKLQKARYLSPPRSHQRSARTCFTLTNHMLSLELWMRSEWHRSRTAPVPKASGRAQCPEPGEGERQQQRNPRTFLVLVPRSCWPILGATQCASSTFFFCCVIWSGFPLLAIKSSWTQALSEIWPRAPVTRHRSSHLCGWPCSSLTYSFLPDFTQDTFLAQIKAQRRMM